MKTLINTLIAVTILATAGCAHKQVHSDSGKSVVGKNTVK